MSDENLRLAGQHRIDKSLRLLDELQVRIDTQLVPEGLSERDGLQARLAAARKSLEGAAPIAIAREMQSGVLPDALKDLSSLAADVDAACDSYTRLSCCVEGVLYRVSCRNSNCGIWVPDKKGFQIARTKFGSTYLATEYHWDTGTPYGTARPYEVLAQLPEFESDEDKLVFLLSWRERLYDNVSEE